MGNEKWRGTVKSQRTRNLEKAAGRVFPAEPEIFAVQLRTAKRSGGFGSRHRDAENALHFVPRRDIAPRFYREGSLLQETWRTKGPLDLMARGRDACGCAWFQVSFARTVISSPIFCLAKGCVVPGRGGIGSSCCPCPVFIYLPSRGKSSLWVRFKTNPFHESFVKYSFSQKKKKNSKEKLKERERVRVTKIGNRRKTWGIFV